MKTIEEVVRYNLKKLRGTRTQEQIAEIAKIPLRSYQRAENGDIPQGPNRSAIAAALGVPETRLFLDPDLATEMDAQRALAVLAEAIRRPVQENAVPDDPWLARMAKLTFKQRQLIEPALQVAEESADEENDLLQRENKRRKS